MINKNKKDNKNNIEEKERLNIFIDKKYNDLLADYSKNNNQYTKENITKSQLVEVALARFFAPLDKNLNLNAEPLEMIRDIATETSIQELQITSAQATILKRELKLVSSSEILDNIEKAKKERENALNTHIVDLRITFKNENIKKPYAYYLPFDPSITEKEAYITPANEELFDLICLCSNISDNADAIKYKIEDFEALKGVKFYALISKKINRNGELIIRIYPLALSNGGDVIGENKRNV